MSTTIETLTDDQIHALEHEALAAGDRDMAATCRLAFYGATEEIIESAKQECADTIRAAEDMTETYIIERMESVMGMWTPLKESTERTGFEMRAVEYASLSDAEDKVARMVDLGGWDPSELRVRPS